MNTNNKPFNFCNNCGQSGHVFHNCKHPITSIGMIVFRKCNEKIQYLLIRRNHSLGFVEFMRGKYPINNYNYLLNIFNEMTIKEKNKIKTSSFDELWKYLWGVQVNIQYRGEERISSEKFQLLTNGIESNKNTYDLEKIINDSNNLWSEPEWGFPKGRRNYQEKELHCALREFEEETGYMKENIKLLQNVIPYEEIFTGSNMKSYKHIYYLGYIDSNIENSFQYQETEVSDVKWMTFDECINCIRPYNLEKINILNKVNCILQQYRLY